jgi:hemoglobin
MQRSLKREFNFMSEQNDTVPSLSEWLGGTEVLNQLTSKFYDRVLKDDLLRPLFAEMPADHPRHVADFVDEVMGGPHDYTATRGGHATMLQHHFGKNISEQQRRRWVSLLLDTADEVGLPADPEFRSALVAYLEWGSRLAVINSQLPIGTVADPATPMPEWDWGVPGGPYIDPSLNKKKG